jgi:hypothetical protein
MPGPRPGMTQERVSGAYDPRVHPSSQKLFSQQMVCRVKPGNDECRSRCLRLRCPAACKFLLITKMILVAQLAGPAPTSSSRPAPRQRAESAEPLTTGR